MEKTVKPISPKKRYALRLIELSKKDPQIGALYPDKTLVEKARAKDLSLGQIIDVFLEGYKERPALGERAYEVVTEPATNKTTRNYLPTYTTTSYEALNKRIKAVSMAWRTHPHCRVEPGDFVMIMGFGDIDFFTVDTACTYTNAIPVPVQSSTSGADLGEIVDNIEPRVIAATLSDLSVAIDLALNHATVKNVIVFNYDERVDEERVMVEQARAKLAKADATKQLLSINELITFGENKTWSWFPNGEDPDETCVAILHSSGSTGKPKGAISPAKAFKNFWIGKATSLPRVTMLLAPLNHIMGRGNLHGILSVGGTGYFTLQPDLSTLLEDIRLARPTYLSLFPRIFELIYKYYQNEVARRERRGQGSKAEIEEAVKKEMRSTYLGDRLLVITFGSAPTAPKVRKFIKECFDVLMLEGYGNTESGTGGITFENKISRENVLDYKLRDVPELGYFTTDKPFPRGELCVKTKYGIQGYYKQPKATENLFDKEGYMCTGDIVEERAPDEVHVIDRRKDVLKLSQGEYVATGTLGTIYEAASAVIKQIYVYGNSERSYLLAVVVLEKEVLHSLLGNTPSDAQIKNLIRDEFNKVAEKEELKPFEVPRDIILEYDHFTQKNGLLSSVRKRLRPALKRKYGPELEALYASHEQAQDDRLATLRSEDSNLSTLEKLVVIVEDQLKIEIPDATEARTFVQLGGDSLGASLFSMSIEEFFGVSLAADEILSPSGNLLYWANYIDKAIESNEDKITFASIHGKGTKIVTVDDLPLERFLDQNLLEKVPSLPAAPSTPKTVLLTGANGFLGHILCLEWLKKLAKTGGKLICLIRAKDDAAAYEKLEKEFIGEDAEMEKLFKTLSKNHLEVVAGDIAKPTLGLSEEHFKSLSKEVDRICHVAALVNHRLSYPHLFGPNVVGTAEVIRLALTDRRKPIDFISSVGVFMLLDVKNWKVLEHTPFKEEIPLSNDYAAGYATSKWAGEQLLRQVQEQFDIPINIFRCDMILPHQEYKGQANVSDMLSRLLYSIVQTGIAPQTFYRNRTSGRRKTPHYEGIPVNLLSQAITEAHTQDHQECRTYHALNYLEDAVSLDRFVDWIASAGYPVHRIKDHRDWYERMETKLKALPEKQRQLSVLQLLMAYQNPMYGGPSGVDCTNFKQLVQSVDSLGNLPHLSEAYIHKYLEDLSQHKMISPPNRIATPHPMAATQRKEPITVNAYAALKPKATLIPYTYELGDLPQEQVDIKVSYCGICHSDLSMIHNEWNNSQYPLIPGHEIIGEVIAIGSAVKNVKVGDKVGVGWFGESCMSCYQCMDGTHHLCRDRQPTITPNNGGFSDYVRAHWAWAIPLPDGIDMRKAGPLLCGGITVFNPIIAAGVLPTDKVGVIGIGGLGHLAVKFLKHWGCEVTAFSSSESKRPQILEMGATRVINSRSREDLYTVAGQLDFIVNTTNVNLDWEAYLIALGPKGKLFNVGMVMEPMSIPNNLLIGGEKVISGSPVGSPSLVTKMLEFCVRHDIYPDVEEFPMEEVNEALAHLEAGKARFRVVLKSRH